MTPNYLPVVVPAVPPRPPIITLLDSAVRPGNGSDPSDAWSVAGEQLTLTPPDLAREMAALRGDAWTRGLTYAPHNHYAAEVRDAYNQTLIDLPALATPAGVTAVGTTTGGQLTAGTYDYRVSALNANGETLACAAVHGIVTSGTTGKVTVSIPVLSDAAQYKVYGRSGTVGLIGTIGPFSADADTVATFVDTGSASPGAVVPTTNTTGGPGTYTNQAIIKYIPPLIVAEDWCSSFGWEERDFKGRAGLLLENAKYKAIEQEFATGALATAAGYPNNYLENNASCVDKTPGTVPSIDGAFAILQQALADCGFGGQGMLHCQRQATPNLLRTRRVGNVLLDEFDNIIVAGVGYRGYVPGGSAPPAGQTTIYATDLVMCREEAYDEAKHVTPNSFAEAIDWGQAGSPNTIRFRAEKFMAAYFDAACHFCCRATTVA